MKCEIVTIIGDNYGNRLQNYALQEVLKDMGAIVTTNSVVHRPILHMLNNFLKSKRISSYKGRMAKFNTKIKWRYVKDNKNLNSSSVDFFIAGSDQIWNPFFPFNSDREFLTFTAPEKRIAYAASIGINELDQVQLKRFKNNLKDFKALSVREFQAANLVEKIIGFRPPVVLDPTMLIPAEKWKKIADESKIKLKKPYIIKYFLGENYSKLSSVINHFAADKSFEIIDIMEQRENMKIGPCEFLYLLKNSQFNFLDSFHGTVFSILFKTNFYTFSRFIESGTGDMNSRFETLLKLFHFEDRYLCGDIKNINLDKQMSFMGVDEVLVGERKFSMEFLKNSLYT